jgi:hypothetical protein
MNGWDDTDEREVALFPPGSRFALIIVSYSKWALATCAMGQKLQLEMLEGIAGVLEPRVMAEIKACCETTRMIVETALTGDGDEELSRSFGILTSREVFRELLRLNPSWLRAIWLCNGAVRRAVA